MQKTRKDLAISFGNHDTAEQYFAVFQRIDTFARIKFERPSLLKYITHFQRDEAGEIKNAYNMLCKSKGSSLVSAQEGVHKGIMEALTGDSLPGKNRDRPSTPTRCPGPLGSYAVSNANRLHRIQYPESTVLTMRSAQVRE
jgi:hypothetical protein